jgi:hypothetical protein
MLTHTIVPEPERIYPDVPWSTNIHAEVTANREIYIDLEWVSIARFLIKDIYQNTQHYKSSRPNATTNPSMERTKLLSYSKIKTK